jgi:hypothetical protein
MKLLPSVDEVRLLLTIGESVVKTAAFTKAAGFGLVSIYEDSGHAVLCRRGQQVAKRVTNEAESIAAFYACIPDLREAWMQIVVARLRESGKRRDLDELFQAISTLGDASERVRQLLPEESLGPTEFGTLEMELFGAGAHQSFVFPMLLRILGATGWIVEGERKMALRMSQLCPVDHLVPKASWCGGRVIQLPTTHGRSLPVAPNRSEALPISLKFVLSGDCSPLSDDEHITGDKPWLALMRWVLYRPWCMLLAQIVFTVEAWTAEQISGQMTLELAEDQISNPYEPKRVDVAVTTPDGSEILCGSLGQLVVRVLDRLQVTLLARDEEVERLDERLAGVIRLLLERKVWRFDPRGAGGSRPGYLIDDDFSTSCYRAFGSKYFYRAGSVLTAAIRSSAEQWASEKQAKSRELAGVER